MGLTAQSVKLDSMKDVFNIARTDSQHVVALAGNPNTGKSTVFNSLTGLKQHTGNWPGKTVVSAKGEFNYNGEKYIIVDLPGSYSLFATSSDEEVPRDFICYGDYDTIVVVADATCLERNLNLVFQISEITDKLILCINLIDEAKKKNIIINKEGLEKELNIPIVLTSARIGTGMDELKDAIENVSHNDLDFSPNLLKYSDEIEEKVEELVPRLEEINILNTRWTALRLLDSDPDIFSHNKAGNISKYQALKLIESLNLQSANKNIREKISEYNYNYANHLKEKYIQEDYKKTNRDKKIDDILTSKKLGIPIMLLMLGLIFWITIQGANIPSQLLSNLLFGLEPKLSEALNTVGAPPLFISAVVNGIYRTLAWVISVMLPPMAIFFPLFSLLEDLGYLPRIAFNMDHLFKKAHAHGKQCLSMCMGFGCNAAGVIGCRIIDSPREKLIAIITNNFVPCNGRFPTIIILASAFFATTSSSFVNGLVPALFITLMVLAGICTTLAVSYLLSKTLLKGVPSTFTLELPPYRIPQIGRLLYTSIIDRTIFVLSRAVAVAAPAGLIIWLLMNINMGSTNIITHIARFLDPVGKIIGLDGFILMAFIMGFPANEIVLPILLMLYLATGTMIEFESIVHLREILVDNGWTALTALNVMLFSLLHWPCSTTMWTIKKETGSMKWTAVAFLMPTCIAFVLCFVTASIYNLIF